MSDIRQAKPRAAAAQGALHAMVYTRDKESEGVFRQSLSDLGAGTVSYVTGGIETAISDLAHRSSPRLLVVDVSGVEDPAARVLELAQVCEPNTSVIVVGDANDVSLYRGLKAEGVVEYFYKPLVGNLVRKACTAIISGKAEQRSMHTGKLVFVIGVKGGVGATGIATWAAWHLAETHRRRVLLLDLDLGAGDAALQLDVQPTHALREALEEPDRVDDLFIERGVIHVTPRLDLLASLEPLDQNVPYSSDAVRSLLTNLLGRYRYVFVDLPHSLAPQLMEVLTMPSMLILVSDGSLVSARDVVRWRDMIGVNTAERETLYVVNKADAHGSLPADAFLRAVGKPPDLTIPYEHKISDASTLGVKGMTQDGALGHALAPVLRHISGEAIEAKKSFISRLLG
jgi:pilus assembly protein CpaE